MKNHNINNPLKDIEEQINKLFFSDILNSKKPKKSDLKEEEEEEEETNDTLKKLMNDLKKKSYLFN